MNNNEKISVIMSVRNGELTLDYSIESILNQTYENFHFYIINDGSTDGTQKILEKYSSSDPRISIFRNKTNIGLTKSLNLLIKKCSTKIIARQDADDFSMKNRFIKQIDFMNNYKVDVCTSRAYIKGTNRITPKYSFYIPKKILINYKNPFIHGTLMIKKSVFIELNYYDEKFYYAQDYKLFSDLLRKKIKIGIIKKPLYVLNMENNISSLNRKEQDYYAKCVQKNLIP